MLIVEPQVELWKQENPVTHVERCARVCYGKTEGKSPVGTLYSNLLNLKHLSMFRHESVYAIISTSTKVKEAVYPFMFGNPYITIWFDRGEVYIATNKNWIIDNKDLQLTKLIMQHLVSPEEFSKTEFGHDMMRYTFHIITQISTSRELNRVSPNNIAEQSTRYVNLTDGAICRPHWMSIEEAEKYNLNQLKDHNGAYTNTPTSAYLIYAEDCFKGYKLLIEEYKVKREDARGILPLDTATEVVYTYSVEEWRHIINLRSAHRAHPNAAIIANMIKRDLQNLGYTI